MSKSIRLGYKEDSWSYRLLLLTLLIFMVSHYRLRGGRALTHNDGAHNEHTQKNKNGACTQRKTTDRRQKNIGQKHRTRSIPGYCCLASQCYLTEGRPLPTRFGVGRDVPSQSLREPAAFQRECWAPVLCWLPVAFLRAHWASFLHWLGRLIHL